MNIEISVVYGQDRLRKYGLHMNEEKKQELSFEKALEQLESIVSNMENKKLPLDEMMKAYEEGKKLSDFCTKKLGEFEKKIEILVKETAEDPVWTEFKS